MGEEEYKTDRVSLWIRTVGFKELGETSGNDVVVKW